MKNDIEHIYGLTFDEFIKRIHEGDESLKNCLSG